MFGRQPSLAILLTSVIVLITSIAIPADRVTEYLEHVERHLIPHYEAARGLDSVWLLQRPFVAYIEVTTMSMWNSEEALTNFFENWPFDEAARDYGALELYSQKHTLLGFRQGQNRGADEPSR